MLSTSASAFVISPAAARRCPRRLWPPREVESQASPQQGARARHSPQRGARCAALSRSPISLAQLGILREDGKVGGG